MRTSGARAPTKGRAAWRAGVALTALIVAGGPGKAAAPRIVSINPCLDGVLLKVADRRQILAVSRYAGHRSSFYDPAAARGVPTTDGHAEDLVLLRPDVVLASGFQGARLARVLAPLGVRVETFSVPKTVDESLAQVRAIARLAGRPAAAALLEAQIRRAVRAAAPPPGAPPVGTLMFENHGLVTGPGTLLDALMGLAGLRNLAPAYGLRRTGRLSLEALALAPPELLLRGDLEPGEPAAADRVLAHPLLRRLARRGAVASFPERLTYCAGPVLVPALAALAAARRVAEARRRS